VYAELHCHTWSSFLDGVSSPGELVARAAELGYEALAVTDHDGFPAAVQVAQAASEQGLPIIYGTELTLRPSERFLKTNAARRPRPDPTTDDAEHLVVLARSPEGYRALSRLCAEAHLRGAKGWPLLGYGHLAPAFEGGQLVALSGCRRGAAPRATDLGSTVTALARLREICGAGRLFVELWHHGQPEDDPRNDRLSEAAARLGLPTVATNNVHYALAEQADVADVVAAVAARRRLDLADGWLPATDERHLKHPAVMSRRLSRAFPGVLETARDLAQECAFDLRLVAPGLPPFPTPPGFSSEMEYLRHLSWEGARSVYDGVPHARQRIEHELDVIEELGFPGYFLIVWDIVCFARSRDIFCQIRGSGADSAVCRCLGLTRVDPIRLGLPFERFLSSERGRPPDIDIDLESDRREEVIQYCYDTYGRERAAMVANQITYRPRSALRDVAKAFGMTPGQVDGISKHIDSSHMESLPDEARLAGLPESRTAELIFRTCKALDGAPRHLGLHSGGMVIADRPLAEVVPVEWATMPERSVLQWDKDDCAAIGIVKFDLLGLGMLSALHYALDMVNERCTGAPLDLATIPQEPEVYDMLCRADTVGLFQVESRAQMATLPRMEPRTFYDLVVEVALIRPGPIQGESVHPYLRRRRGAEPVRYPHPCVIPILERTLGVPVFQEQLMELARVAAGFTPGQCDRLRQAMTHKRGEREMEKLRDECYGGMSAHGVVGPAADEIWRKLQGFAHFGFPESHSVSFAYIVYMSAWLKYHHPAAFLAGVLNAQPMGFYSPHSLVHDAARHGVATIEPDINLSERDCTLEPAAPGVSPVPVVEGFEGRCSPFVVRLGLRYVRNLAVTSIERILLAREAGGPFLGPEDLARRTGLTTDALEGLAAGGAFGSVGLTRRAALWTAGSASASGPDRLPIGLGANAPAAIAPMDAMESARADLWALGLSPRSHPVEFVREHLAAQGCVTIADLSHLSDGRQVRVGGVVTHRQRPGTAHGVIFYDLEDETGLLNVIVLPDVYRAHLPLARRANGLVIHGILERREGVTNLLARRMQPLPSPVAPTQARNFR
jgi:error-prone DNA polymerase